MGTGFISGIQTINKVFRARGLAANTVAAGVDYVGTEVDCSGWGFGIFQTSIVSNVRAAPMLTLEQRLDTTTWVPFATIHPDFTTTANNKMEEVWFHGDYLRLRIASEATTSFITSFRCIAKLKGVE